VLAGDAELASVPLSPKPNLGRHCGRQIQRFSPEHRRDGVYIRVLVPDALLTAEL